MLSPVSPPSRILSTASPQAYDAKTHPLLWQHPSKKQTLLELAARSSWPALLRSLLPALNLSRLAGSGALSAGACGASLLPCVDLPSHPACLPVISIPSPSPAQAPVTCRHLLSASATDAAAAIAALSAMVPMLLRMH